MSGKVQRAIVYGGGVPAAMAALAIARAYRRLDIQVTWIDSGTLPPAHAALAGPPDLATFHRLLGIADGALVDHAAATVNMGQQFAGWSGGEGWFLHAYGDAGTPFASLPLVQHWARARKEGLGVALEDFSLAAAAAKQGRTGQPASDRSGQAVKAGWHIDAASYARLLRAACERDGVRIVPGAGMTARRRDGTAWLEAIDVADEQLTADLFIDADGALIDLIDPDRMIARPDYCDRLIRGSAAPFDPLPLYSRAAANAAGWMTLIPLSNRTAIEFAYDSRLMSDEAALAALPAAAGRPVDAGAPEALGVSVRPQPWVGNVVAIGPAVGDAPALDSAELLLLQLGIAQLVLLWPLDRQDMPEAGIYNDETAGAWARVADFTAQHFRLNGREGEAFWDRVRALPVSEELATKIELFAARGMFAHFNHEAHVEDSWAMCMTGHGLIPRSFDPIAWLVEDQELMAEFQRQLGAVAADVRAMESHAEALGRMRG